MAASVLLSRVTGTDSTATYGVLLTAVSGVDSSNNAVLLVAVDGADTPTAGTPHKVWDGTSWRYAPRQTWDGADWR